MRIVNFLRRNKMLATGLALCTAGVTMVAWSVVRENVVFFENATYLVDLFKVSVVAIGVGVCCLLASDTTEPKTDNI